MAEFNGKALAAIGIGALFVWSGVKGWSVLGSIKDIIAGQPPKGSGVSYPFITPTRDELMSGSPDENRSPLLGGISGNVADNALLYAGHAYRFGGAPGADGSQPWDCSSFVNWIVGTKMGRAIPGYGPGKYRGEVHGPPTGTWGIWFAGMMSIGRNNVARGDIIVWVDHMGIAVDNQHMISALSPSDGTKVTPIDGYGNGPLMMVGRLK